MSAQIERMQEHLKHLRLHRIQSLLEPSLEEAARNSLSYSDFLDGLLSQEVASKTEKNVAMRTSMARFPFVKTLESLDFAFQPSIDKKKIKELAACRYIANGENVILLGSPGVGKTHLAVALGVKAVTEGYRTCFTQAMPLIASLTKAYAENRIEERLKFYCQAKLLIIDEIGYIPIDRHGAHLFFQLISRRYEKGGSSAIPSSPRPSWIGSFTTRRRSTSRETRTGSRRRSRRVLSGSRRSSSHEQVGVIFQ
jgi:DNA replication protein DnaC